MHPSPAKILFLPVVYYSHDDAAEQLANLQELPGADQIAVVAVDNSEPAPAIPGRKDGFASFDVVSGQGNAGYFGGARLGLAHYRQTVGLPEWVIISNTDARIQQTDFIERLLALHDSCAVSKTFCIAPDIRSSKTGAPQNPYYATRPRSTKFARLARIFRHYWLAIAYRLLSHAKGLTRGWRSAPTAAAGEIYAPHGSFLCLHRSYFEAGGTLDHRAFLYGEEIFVAEEIRRLGGRTLFVPELKVVHLHSVTTGLISSRAVIRHLAEGTRVCAELLAT
jgi:GT2 family glycosyltransferase